MTPEEKYELFDKYCTQELSAEEKEQLDVLINEDASMAEELQTYVSIHKHLGAELGSETEFISLKNNLKTIGGNYFEEKPKEKEVKVIRIPSWTYAAAASIAIIFGIFLFNQGDPTYNDFAVIPELTITERGAADEIAKKAEDAFNGKQYPEAEKQLVELLNLVPNNATYQFYYGITLVELDKFEDASVVFNKLIKGNSVYKYKAQWFEALNQLKQEKYAECSELLKSIPAEAEDYDQAQKLLKKLD